MELNEDDKTPLTVNEDIINYLKEQDLLDVEEDEELYENLTNFTEDQVKNVLDELLNRLDKRQQIKDNYAARTAGHNQKQLFDLKSIFPDFEIDEEMYDMLTFRETLLICTYKGDEDCTMSSVGGLCLDIQKAIGAQPPERKNTDIEERIKNILNFNKTDEVNADVIMNGSVKSDDSKGCDVPELEDDLETQRKRGLTKFLVHLSCQFDMHTLNAGSSITAWVDKNFHTLEELRKEFYVEDFDNEKQFLQKTLYTALEKRCYYVKHTCTIEDRDDRKFYSLQKARDYISEGANFILQRYLAIIRYIGTFELSTMYINGDMCRNIYACLGPEGEVINGQRVDGCKICRTIIEECGIEHKCITTLTLQGQIIKQEWEGLEYVLQVNPMALIKNETPSGNERLLLKNAWVDDMQLLSKYLDEKMTCSMKIQSFMLDHPELRDLITDYVNSILLMKPEDILDFTIDHFLRYAPQFMPQNDYFL